MGRQRLVPAQVLVAGAVVIDDERLVVGLTLSRLPGRLIWSG